MKRHSGSAAPSERPSASLAVGSLAFSCVVPQGACASVRAIEWDLRLERLGVRLPFFIVHDLGLALVAGEHEATVGPRFPSSEFAALAGRGVAMPDDASLERYAAMIAEVRRSEVARRASQLALGDEVVAVVLARLLERTAEVLAAGTTAPYPAPDRLSRIDTLTPKDVLERCAVAPRQLEAEALTALLDDALTLLALVDALDVDTLQLFGLAGLSESGARAHLDLLACLRLPSANDVVNFSLELLPSVLETRTRPGHGSTLGQGYSGLAARGTLDSLVLTELAWDDEEFVRRMAENEVLYHAREQGRTERRKSHLVLVDASASMRGDRSTFARALALATGKKLALAGDEVSFRFFDSRLYEPHAAVRGELPTAALLSFRGERGRNPTRVFRDLLVQLALKKRDEDLVVHLFTHAALYIPRPLVAELAACARIAAVFMLPSGGVLDLDYLDLLASHWVVDHATLGHAERTSSALRILDGVRT